MYCIAFPPLAMSYTIVVSMILMRFVSEGCNTVAFCFHYGLNDLIYSVSVENFLNEGYIFVRCHFLLWLHFFLYLELLLDF